MSILTHFIKINPTLMTQLIQGQLVDLGDGLQVLFGGWPELDKYPGHYFFKSQDKICDGLYFSFFLEGKHVGGLDNDFGGCIHPNYENEVVADLCEDDMRLQEQVTDRMVELFPGYDCY